MSRYPGAVVWRGTRASVGAVSYPVLPHPVLPDGCMDLLWTAGTLVVAGPDTHAFVPEPGVFGDIVGIRFAPGTAPALLGVPAEEFRDRRVELADVWSAAETRRLTERIGAASDPGAALEAIAVERLVVPDRLLLRLADELQEGRAVGQIADAVGVTARNLHRRSLAAFGYGPKTLARILRLQRALALARAGTPYAETAVVAGFADQAHLARDVRELTGSTLSGLLSLRS